MSPVIQYITPAVFTADGGALPTAEVGDAARRRAGQGHSNDRRGVCPHCMIARHGNEMEIYSF